MDEAVPASREARAIRSHPQPHLAFLQTIRNRLQSNLDAFILLTGYVGHGKSTCAEHICRTIDSSFDNSRIPYNTTQYLELIRDLEPGQAVMPDEAVEMFHNRNSMTKDNKMVNEVLMECRVKNLLHAACFPRLENVDVLVRESRTWAWVRCLEPGFAEVRLRGPGIPIGDTTENALQRTTKVCNLTYPAIDEERWDEREDRKTKFLDDKISEYIHNN